MYIFFLDTRKRKRRTRSVRRRGIEKGGRTETEAGMKENVPAVRRTKTKNGKENETENGSENEKVTATASLTVIKET